MKFFEISLKIKLCKWKQIPENFKVINVWLRSFHPCCDLPAYCRDLIAFVTVVCWYFGYQAIPLGWDPFDFRFNSFHDIYISWQEFLIIAALIVSFEFLQFLQNRNILKSRKRVKVLSRKKIHTKYLGVID